jgi:hypothetical protein
MFQGNSIFTGMHYWAALAAVVETETMPWCWHSWPKLASLPEVYQGILDLCQTMLSVCVCVRVCVQVCGAKIQDWSLTCYYLHVNLFSTSAEELQILYLFQHISRLSFPCGPSLRRNVNTELSCSLVCQALFVWVQQIWEKILLIRKYCAKSNN